MSMCCTNARATQTRILHCKATTAGQAAQTPLQTSPSICPCIPSYNPTAHTLLRAPCCAHPHLGVSGAIVAQARPNHTLSHWPRVHHHLDRLSQRHCRPCGALPAPRRLAQPQHPPLQRQPVAMAHPAVGECCLRHLQQRGRMGRRGWDRECAASRRHTTHPAPCVPACLACPCDDPAHSPRELHPPAGSAPDQLTAAATTALDARGCNYRPAAAAAD